MKRIILICFSIISFSCLGQESQNEELWSGLGAKIKLIKKIRLDLEHQVRFQNYFQEYNYTFTEIGLNYKPTKKIRSYMISYEDVIGDIYTLSYAENIPETIITSFVGNSENSWVNIRFGNCRMIN